MSILKRKRNVVLASLAAVGIIAAGTVAYAAFTSQASASASGNSANMQALTVGVTSIDFAGSENNLWPNVGPDGNDPGTAAAGSHLARIDVPVTNPNEVGVTVSSADIAGSAFFTDGGVQALCGGHLFLTPITIEGGPIALGATGAWNDHTTLVVDYAYLRWDAPNTCANRAFSTTWTITAHQL